MRPTFRNIDARDCGAGRRLVRRWVAAVATCLFLGGFAPAAAQDEPAADSAALGEVPIFSRGDLSYRPGRGLRHESLGLVLGGFTNLKLESTDESGEELTLDLLNFFLIFDYFERLRGVADLQLKDVVAWDRDRSGVHDFAFDVRRLFADLTVSDEVRVRVGTFLTPIGYWNLILAPPLTWTTEAPLIAEETFFEQTTTGAMVHGTVGALGGRVGYAVFGHFLDPLESDPDLKPADHAGGLRLTYDRGPSWSVGASFQSAETDNVWSHLGAVHGVWQQGRFASQVEAYVEDIHLEGVQWGGYLQGVVEVVEPFSLVARYEHLAPPSNQNSVHTFTFGGVYRPLPFMALKAEYRFGDRGLTGEDLDGFFFSFTTFF